MALEGELLPIISTISSLKALHLDNHLYRRILSNPHLAFGSARARHKAIRAHRAKERHYGKEEGEDEDD